MNKQTNQQLDYLVMKKQIAVYLAGSSQNYQNYKRTQQIQSFYPNDLDYYNDTFYYRHERNLEELKKIKQLLKKKIIRPEMLLYNTLNTFYSSYVLHHHIFIYTEIVKLFSENQIIQQLYEKAKLLNQHGAYFEKMVNVKFQKNTNHQKPQITQDGKILMKKDLFFFDKHISLYYHVACFVVKKENQNVLVFVKIRDNKGQLCKDVTVRDLGQRISSDYLQIGYNFDQVKPFLVIKIKNQSNIDKINNMSYFYQYNLSLLDLRKSLFVALKYTNMRQQFSTLPESKQERPIFTYQAVGSRIMNAFSKFICFSQLNRSLINNKSIIPFVSQMLDINHHFILQSIIRLRQCCGGFGFLQVSGHGSGIQRVSLRASEAVSVDIPQNPQILKRLHYYSSSDDMESYFGDIITKQFAFNPNQIFAVFVNICVNMRKSASQLKKQVYSRHFMLQAAIQVLKNTQQFTRLPKDSIIFSTLYYELANYIIDNSQFINWAFIQKHFTREQYFHSLLEFRNNYLNQLLTKASLIEEILQINYLRNVVIGRENKQQFYEEVLLTAKKNLRNSEQFTDYVKKPIVDFLIANNKAKL